MVFSQSPNRIGMLAGGIAMMIALLAMQLLSRVFGIRLLISEYLPGIIIGRLLGQSGELARFLLSGDPWLRVTIFLWILLLIAGAGLGRWVYQEPSQLSQRVMQAAAILLFATFTLLYVAHSGMLEFSLQEILITLAVSYLLYAMVLIRLLDDATTLLHWKIAGVVAVFGFITVCVDIWIR